MSLVVEAARRRNLHAAVAEEETVAAKLSRIANLLPKVVLPKNWAASKG